MKLTPRTEYNLLKSAIYVSIAIVLSYLLFSCGSRKVETNKIEKESVTKQQSETNTKETIQETVTSKIDTIVAIPERSGTISAPISSITESEPMIYEDDAIKSVTKYNRNTGVLSNEVIRKRVDVPVKAETTTNRTIERDIQAKSNTESVTKEKSKVKDVERKSSWGWIIAVISGGVAYLLIWLIMERRKRKEVGDV